MNSQREWRKTLKHIKSSHGLDVEYRLIVRGTDDGYFLIHNVLFSLYE